MNYQGLLNATRGNDVIRDKLSALVNQLYEGKLDADGEKMLNTVFGLSAAENNTGAAGLHELTDADLDLIAGGYDPCLPSGGESDK